jgi:SWI/SNF-related matrix-associated actin-dependent regulator of chromatin subfamily D
MIHQIYNHRLKRDFMLTFASDPVEFIQQWIASQSRDLEVRWCELARSL